MKQFFVCIIASASILLFSSTQTIAQTKPNKELAKKMIGAWQLEKMEFKLTEDKTTEEERGMAAMLEGFGQAMMDSLKGSIKYSFNKNGSFQLYEKSRMDRMEEGRWKLEGNKLILMNTDGEIKSPSETIMAAMEGKMLLISSGSSQGLSIVLRFRR